MSFEYQMDLLLLSKFPGQFNPVRQSMLRGNADQPRKFSRMRCQYEGPILSVQHLSLSRKSINSIRVQNDGQAGLLHQTSHEFSGFRMRAKSWPQPDDILSF